MEGIGSASCSVQWLCMVSFWAVSQHRPGRYGPGYCLQLTPIPGLCPGTPGVGGELKDLAVRHRHVHPRYDHDSGDNDLALLELALPLQCPDEGRPICVPEGDFAKHVLVPGNDGLLSGWTLNGSELAELPTQLLVMPLDSSKCASTLNMTITTRTYCERVGMVKCRAVPWGAGSAVIRQHRGTWFLTGLLSSASPEQPVLLLTKVSRYELWFRQVMGMG